MGLLPIAWPHPAGMLRDVHVWSDPSPFRRVAGHARSATQNGCSLAGSAKHPCGVGPGDRKQSPLSEIPERDSQLSLDSATLQLPFVHDAPQRGRLGRRLTTIFLQLRSCRPCHCSKARGPPASAVDQGRYLRGPMTPTALGPGVRSARPRVRWGSPHTPLHLGVFSVPRTRYSSASW